MVIRNFPWLSLSLLLLTYSAFGWLLANLTDSWLVWVAAGSLALFLDLALTAPLTLVRIFLGTWIQTDKIAFLSIIFFSFGAVVILCWFEFFARILVLLSAGALARLDLQTAGYHKGQTLIILFTICTLGYSAGVLASLWAHAGEVLEVL